MSFMARRETAVVVQFANSEPLTTTLKENIVFSDETLIRSPLTRHNANGIPKSERSGFSWAFDVTGRWDVSPKPITMYVGRVELT